MVYQSYTLPSGLRLLHRSYTSPVVYIGIAIGVGTRHESRRAYGIAHFTEHMLFKGTKLRNAKQLILRLEEVGGELNAYTSKEETILYAICPKPYAQRALQLMADIVQHSTFAPSELSKEQTVVIDEIHGYEDSPSELIWDEFEELIFKGHPLGHSILGSERSVRALTSRQVANFYRQHYRQNNMLIFVQGDVDFTALSALVQNYFPCNAPAPYHKHNYDKIALREQPRHIVRKRGTHQRHILIGASAYPMFDKRRLGLSLLVNLLGGPGMSSRLNMTLREDAGLVYQIDCSYTAYSDTGLVAISLGCAGQHEKQALALVEQELRLISSEPLSEQELQAAKRQLKGQLTVANDSIEHAFLSLGKAFLHHNKVDTLEQTMQRIDALSRDELWAIAQEIFPPERMYTLIYR